MRWEYFDDVPVRILDKYWPTSRDDVAASLSAHKLCFAAHIYWDRNTPKKVRESSVTPSIYFDKEFTYRNWVVVYWPRHKVYYRHRYFEPLGFMTNTGMWVPHPDEVQACCKGRKSAKHIPWAYKKHCNSIQHVALSYGVDPKELKEYIIEDLGPHYKPHCNHCGSFAVKNDIYCKKHRYFVDMREDFNAMI